jgi:hypothetical protein
MITIFTCPKPFVGHIGTIQRNAIMSWKALHSSPEIILFGDEIGTEDISKELGLFHISDTRKNRYGTPQLDDVFKKAYQNAHYDILCFVNADIILLQDFIEAIEKARDLKNRFLLVGQRWDIDLNIPEIPSDEKMYSYLETYGKLHPRAGSDFFVFPKDVIINIPALSVGRAGWDNWMIYNAIETGIPTIDISPVSKVIHQNHDYKHVKDSTGTAYENPESDENLKYIIGRPFTLDDSIYTLTPNGLKRDILKNVFTCFKIIVRKLREKGWK